MISPLLVETVTFDQAKMVVETIDNPSGQSKDLFMEGIFIQGGVKNENKRIYPINEIQKAVQTISERLKSGFSVLGECDHPDSLQVNLDRVTHLIDRMWMDGPNGLGKLKLLPTPMGNIVRAMVENRVKLGVSSRGRGNVADDGMVSEFEIVTVDIVAQPSAPNAYPNTVYESIYGYSQGSRRGRQLYDLAEAKLVDKAAGRYFSQAIVKAIEELKLR